MYVEQIHIPISTRGGEGEGEGVLVIEDESKGDWDTSK